MRFCSSTLFIDKALVAHLTYDPKEQDWPITLTINGNNEVYGSPQIDIFFNDKSSYINFKDSINQGYEKCFKDKEKE